MLWLFASMATLVSPTFPVPTHMHARANRVHIGGATRGAANPVASAMEANAQQDEVPDDFTMAVGEALEAAESVLDENSASTRLDSRVNTPRTGHRNQRLAEDVAWLLVSLGACGGASAACAASLRASGALADQGEWSMVLLDELEAALSADSVPAAGGWLFVGCLLALRACALAEHWGGVESVARRAAASAGGDGWLLAAELEGILVHYHSVSSPDEVAGSATDPAADASGIDSAVREIGGLLADSQLLSHYWHAEAMLLTLPSASPAPVVHALLTAALENLVQLQREAGPARSTIKTDLRIGLASSISVERGSSAAIIVAAAAGILEASSDFWVAVDATEAAGAATRPGSPDARLASVSGPLGLPLQTSAQSSWHILQADVEAHVCRRCMLLWQTDAEVEASREAAAASEEEAKRAATAAAETAEAERRQAAWARRNARSVSAAEQKSRLDGLTTLGAAMDTMVQKLVQKGGEPTGGIVSEPDGAAMAKPTQPSDRGSPDQVTRRETSADDIDVSAVRGIGPKRAASLRAAGVKTAAALADISTGDDEAATLARRCGLPLRTLMTCIENAREARRG